MNYFLSMCSQCLFSNFTMVIVQLLLWFINSFAMVINLFNNFTLFFLLRIYSINSHYFLLRICSITPYFLFFIYLFNKCVLLLFFVTYLFNNFVLLFFVAYLFNNFVLFFVTYLVIKFTVLVLLH